MNRYLAQLTPLFALGAALSVAIPSGAATITTSTTAPDAGTVLVSNPTFNTFTRTFSTAGTGADFNNTRGQTFTLGGTSSNTFNVGSVTVRKDSTQTFNAGAQLTIWLFEYVAGGGNPGWQAGDGHGDGDPLNGTNLTAFVNGDTIDIGGDTFTGGDFVTFNFDAPVSLAGDAEYGFLIGLKGLAGSNNFFQFGRGDGFSDGTMINTSSGGNGTLGQDVTFYINTVIPEPASVTLLGLGGVLIAGRRRRA